MILRMGMCILLVIGALQVSGQDSTSNVPRQALKFSPLHLIGFHPTLEFAFEQRIYEKITGQIEYGYVLDYSFPPDEDYDNRKGYKLKAEVRYYFLSLPKRFLMYGAGEFYYNEINYDHSVQGQDCFDPDCQFPFVRTYTYRVNLREHGYSLKFGFMKYFNRDFFMDINGGFRVRYLDYNEEDIPSFDTVDDEWDGPFELQEETDDIVLRFAIGVKFGYRFR